MASTMTRRPLPALLSLIALLILVGIVWWRVAHRDTDATASPLPSSTACTPSAGTARTDASSAPTSAPTSAPSSAAVTDTVPTVSPAGVTVQVLNSTERSGIAASARSALLKAGFRVPSAAGNDSGTVRVTAPAQIRYGSAGRQGALLLQYYFPGAQLTRVDSSAATVIVSLGDGYRSVASGATVAAELARARSGAAPTATPAVRPSGASPAPAC